MMRQHMTTHLRQGLVAQQEPVRFRVKSSAMNYIWPVMASYHGGNFRRRNRLKGGRGRGTLAGEKPPILGLIQRGGDVCIQMLENVQQKTIEPLIKKALIPGTLIYTDATDGWKLGAICRGSSWSIRTG